MQSSLAHVNNCPKLRDQIVLLLALSMLIIQTGVSKAEGACPPGSYQTTPQGPHGPIGCAPLPTKNSKAVMLDRWGAFASDKNGNWGISSDMKSKSLAEQAALNTCRERGGIDCQSKFNYFNQCSAVVASTQSSGMSSAETEKKAIEIATATCTRTSGGAECWVYYSGCSLPVRAGS